MTGSPRLAGPETASVKPRRIELMKTRSMT
jgi:hypothetical protein